ncbi:MAG: hypothetical protein MUF49_12940 [Oculatellaceae cyanobacterium Prado106]|nr:hypothetical protein [Oculatellaceae cyanobacterium Prado106]
MFLLLVCSNRPGASISAKAIGLKSSVFVGAIASHLPEHPVANRFHPID